MTTRYYVGVLGVVVILVVYSFWIFHGTNNSSKAQQLVVGTFSSDTTHLRSEHLLLRSLVKQMNVNTAAEKCAPERYQEWNEVVKIRYNQTKEKLGILESECLLATATVSPDYWGPSGMGSSAFATEPLRKLLRSLFRNKSYNIKSFFDAPCGDWLWMQYVDLTGIAYIGGDITQITVTENSKCFSKSNIHFTTHDLSCNTPPPVDLMLTRDVLFHLQDDVVMKILSTISKSKVRYFLSTTFDSKNAEHPFVVASYQETLDKRGANSSIGYRVINLMDKPFCLPQPVLRVKENVPGDRYIAMWKLPFVVGNCGNN